MQDAHHFINASSCAQSVQNAPWGRVQIARFTVPVPMIYPISVAFPPHTVVRTELLSSRLAASSCPLFTVRGARNPCVSIAGWVTARTPHGEYNASAAKNESESWTFSRTRKHSHDRADGCLGACEGHLDMRHRPTHLRLGSLVAIANQAARHAGA